MAAHREGIAHRRAARNAGRETARAEQAGKGAVPSVVKGHLER